MLPVTELYQGMQVFKVGSLSYSMLHTITLNLNSISTDGLETLREVPLVHSGWLDGKGNAIHLVMVPRAVPFSVELHQPRVPCQTGAKRSNMRKSMKLL